jgi:hypothetical protein
MLVAQDEARIAFFFGRIDTRAFFVLVGLWYSIAIQVFSRRRTSFKLDSLQHRSASKHVQPNYDGAAMESCIWTLPSKVVTERCSCCFRGQLLRQIEGRSGGQTWQFQKVSHCQGSCRHRAFSRFHEKLLRRGGYYGSIESSDRSLGMGWDQIDSRGGTCTRSHRRSAGTGLKLTTHFAAVAVESNPFYGRASC